MAQQGAGAPCKGQRSLEKHANFMSLGETRSSILRKQKDNGLWTNPRGPYKTKRILDEVKRQLEDANKKNEELDKQNKRLESQVEQLTRDLDAMGQLITILKGDAGPDGDGGLGVCREGVSSGEGFGIGNAWLNGNASGVNEADALICLHHSPRK